MKIDIDSILYIVITIVILIISGLGSRRKKLAQQMQAKAPVDADEDYPEPDPIEFQKAEYNEPVRSREASPSPHVPSPLERLDQFITGKFPEAVSLEGESLEETVDEEELILEEIQRSRENEHMEVPEEKQAEQVIQIEKPGQKGLPPLFDNLHEVKKAIIYSEIIHRKYQ